MSVEARNDRLRNIKFGGSQAGRCSTESFSACSNQMTYCRYTQLFHRTRPRLVPNRAKHTDTLRCASYHRKGKHSDPERRTELCTFPVSYCSRLRGCNKTCQPFIGG